MAILERFEKQPRETKAYDVSFLRYLQRNNTTARPLDPIESEVQEGITLEAVIWVNEGGYAKVVFSGGQDRKTYKATVWLNTAGGERLEADIEIKVKES